MRWIALAFVLVANPLFAQTAPNRLEVVQFVTNEDPARFACAHSGRSCEADWIKAVASELHAEDQKFGLNAKRDGPEHDISLDVVTYRIGPTDRHVLAFDICGACGSPSARVVWNDITDRASIGRPGTARWVKPPSSVVVTPPPVDPVSPDLAAIRADITSLRAALLAEIAILKANHDGIAAVATEARDKAAEAAFEALNAASRASEIKTQLDNLPAGQPMPCLVGRVPRALGGSSEVVFCPR